jgi:hypothetical protein
MVFQSPHTLDFERRPRYRVFSSSEAGNNTGEALHLKQAGHFRFFFACFFITVRAATSFARLP